MNTSDTQTPDAPEFEGRVRALLTQYAKEMPASVDTETRVRERLAAPVGVTSPERRAVRWPGPRLPGGWARGAVSLGLVAALIAGFFAVVWLRNNQGNGTRNQCSEARQVSPDGSSSLTHVCSLDNINVQVSVAHSYADATRTSLEIRVATPGALIPHGQPITDSQPSDLLLDATLNDQQGDLYTMSRDSLGGPALLTYTSGQEVATGIAVFDPLPEGALTAPQTLTLRISHITAHTMTGWSSPVKGEFTTTFQVTPHAGRTIKFNVAPQTHGGITLQPLQMDIAPDASVFDGYGGGGERLLLRISGLPADADAGKVADISTSVTTPVSSDTTNGQTTLKLEGQEPAAVGGIPWDFFQSNSPVVGPSGTIILAVIFVSPPLRTLTGTQRLTVDQIMSSFNGQEGPVPGPWTFLLPLG
jgi:hypothetical protein